MNIMDKIGVVAFVVFSLFALCASMSLIAYVVGAGFEILSKSGI